MDFRINQEKSMDRKTHDQLTEVLARVLHYHDRGRPDPFVLSFAELQKEYAELPPRIIERFRNDALFHAKVQEAVQMVIEVLEPTPQLERDRINALALECAQMSRITR
jgi:hypothetical protein